jgi:hypothetical protein
MKAMNPGRRIDRAGGTSVGRFRPDPDNSRKSENPFRVYPPVNRSRPLPLTVEADGQTGPEAIPSGLFAKKTKFGSILRADRSIEADHFH